MEAYATLLNTILTRIVFNHMTMFFVFLFSSFYFMPPELAAEMNAKTPPFFPDWFPLSAMGSFVFTFIATAIWILLCNGVKWLYQTYHRTALASSEQEKLIQLIPTLSDLEKEILALSCLGERICPNNIPTKIAIEKLINLKLISYAWVSNRYDINPLVRPFIINELDNMTKTHH